MAIGDICNKKIIIIEKESSLSHAAKVMKDNNIGSLLVVEANHKKSMLIGIITDRDIALALSDDSLNKKSLIKHVMNYSPIVVKKNDGIFFTTMKMKKYGIHRIPVINDNGSLFGIISSDDIFKLMTRELANLSKISKDKPDEKKVIFLPYKMNRLSLTEKKDTIVIQ